jgi:hypothetical protein
MNGVVQALLGLKSFDQLLLSMKLAMLITRKNHKIFKVIISLVTVHVMDVLSFLQFSTKSFFHYMTMDVIAPVDALACRERKIMGIDTFPKAMLLTFLKRTCVWAHNSLRAFIPRLSSKFGNGTATSRAEFYPSVTSCPRLENRFTVLASYRNHPSIIPNGTAWTLSLSTVHEASERRRYNQNKNICPLLR